MASVFLGLGKAGGFIKDRVVSFSRWYSRAVRRLAANALEKRLRGVEQQISDAEMERGKGVVVAWSRGMRVVSYQRLIDKRKRLKQVIGELTKKA